jgi:hypothetical protein
MTHSTQHRAGLAAQAFLAATRDSEHRVTSVRRYLRQIFDDIAPADLTNAETTEFVSALRMAYRRVTGATTKRVVPLISRGDQLHEILAQVALSDLTADEAMEVLILLIPIHSRVIFRDGENPACHPLQRFFVTCGGGSQE